MIIVNMLTLIVKQIIGTIHIERNPVRNSRITRLVSGRKNRSAN